MGVGGKAADRQAASVAVMRSRLGRVRGLGAARSGTAHWWAERVTSVALIPLTLWFVLAALHLSGLARGEVAHWAGHPLNAALLLALVLVTFHHMRLGLQVVIEDYIHRERSKLAALLLVQAAIGLVGLMAVVAVLKLALAG